MNDPLETLYEAVLPVDPDPTFAAALRAQLAQALLLGTGETMSNEASTKNPPVQGDVGYASLWVPDVALAESFYGSVLGWQFAPGSIEQGRQVTGLPNQHIGMWGGQPRSGTLISFAVDDANETVRRVRAAGGRADEPAQEPYGLAAMCADDQGMEFSIFQSPVSERDPAPMGRAGEIVYLTFEVADTARFRAFFGAVFGWHFSQGRSGGDRFTGTFGVFIAMLVVYKTGAIRVTPRLTKWIIGATFGVLVVVLANFVIGMFGVNLGLRDGSPLSIFFSILIIGIAAFNLLLDFDQADRMIRMGMPARWAWYAAFGLTVTLVWLYLEILRLLSYLQRGN